MNALAKLGLGAAAGLLFTVGTVSTASAGEASLVVDVSGEVRCLPTGEAEITWEVLADLDVPEGPIEVPAPGLAPQGLPSAVVEFSGTQSGAASGSVTFDPNDFIITPLSPFPVSSTAVAIVSGTSGGTVDLDATVRITDTENPLQFVEGTGDGSVELPICPQPLQTVSTTAAVQAERVVTQPRFTG